MDDLGGLSTRYWRPHWVWWGNFAICPPERVAIYLDEFGHSAAEQADMVPRAQMMQRGIKGNAVRATQFAVQCGSRPRDCKRSAGVEMPLAKSWEGDAEPKSASQETCHM